MTNAADIVAYTYNAEILCPECTRAAVAHLPKPYPAATSTWSVETLLGFIASHIGVQRMDEDTFDSGDFPKVVFRDQIDTCENVGWDGSCDARCDSCGEELL